MKEDDDLVAALAAEAEASPPEAAEPATLERMQALAAEVNKIDDELGELEAQVKELVDRRNKILGKDLIEMMDTKHVEKLQVSGRIFKAGPYFKAAIPAENPMPGLDWLEAHEAGDLIKNEVGAVFPRGFEEEAQEAFKMLVEHYQMATIERKRSVHWATLTSWLKEMHLSTDPNKVMPPLDIIGGIIGRVVKVTNAKE